MFCLIIYLSENRMDYIVFGPYVDYDAADKDFNLRIRHRYAQVEDYVIIKMMEIEQ